jgi:hypothetical protein
LWAEFRDRFMRAVLDPDASHTAGTARHTTIAVCSDPSVGFVRLCAAAAGRASVAALPLSDACALLADACTAHAALTCPMPAVQPPAARLLLLAHGAAPAVGAALARRAAGIALGNAYAAAAAAGPGSGVPRAPLSPPAPVAGRRVG